MEVVVRGEIVIFSKWVMINVLSGFGLCELVAHKAIVTIFG